MRIFGYHYSVVIVKYSNFDTLLNGKEVRSFCIICYFVTRVRSVTFKIQYHLFFKTYVMLEPVDVLILLSTDSRTPT